MYKPSSAKLTIFATLALTVGACASSSQSGREVHSTYRTENTESTPREAEVAQAEAISTGETYAPSGFDDVRSYHEPPTDEWVDSGSGPVELEEEAAPRMSNRRAERSRDYDSGADWDDSEDVAFESGGEDWSRGSTWGSSDTGSSDPSGGGSSDDPSLVSVFGEGSGSDDGWRSRDSWDDASRRYQSSRMVLTASTVADHDRRQEYLSFLQRYPYEVNTMGLDMTRRMRFQVVDDSNRPINDARITIEQGGASYQGRSHADGVWDFYPGVDARSWQGQLEAVIQAGQERREVSFSLPNYGDGEAMLIRLEETSAASPNILDLSFLIDVTGSMSDELRYVNDEVVEIVRRIESVTPGLQVRISATFYRDRGDEFLVRQIPFTENVEGFADTMQRVNAGGGGDYPEDLNAGFDAAFNNLEWTSGNAVRVLVVIADAPPQEYDTSFSYREALHFASNRGIRILPVAASGADRSVEVLFRALGTFTSTPYVYLTDHSGVGGSHLEADTSSMSVEYFNDLLSRLIISDLQGEGMHERESQHQPLVGSR